ncbi:MAG: RNA polymerase sigma factor [Spirochaetales bacterium]
MEQQLILKAMRGDRTSFALLTERYYKRVHSVALRIVRNYDDAGDIAQETFLRAFRKFNSFDTSRPLFPWLYQIATNLSINHIKRVRRREGELPEFDVLETRDDGPEDVLLQEDEVERVRNAVQLLPESSRMVIELNHFDECSYAEIAEILSIPIGTVMSRLYHARKKLRTIMIEGGSDAK